MFSDQEKYLRAGRSYVTLAEDVNGEATKTNSASGTSTQSALAIGQAPQLPNIDLLKTIDTDSSDDEILGVTEPSLLHGVTYVHNMRYVGHGIHGRHVNTFYTALVIPPVFINSFDKYYIYYGPESTNLTYLANIRNVVVNRLVRYSDYNANVFLLRAFATKNGIDTIKDLFNTMLTGGSAAASPFNGIAGGAISLANLMIGRAADDFDSSFYLSKTFDAMSSAILSQRQLVINDINTHCATNYAAYDINKSLTDIEHLDAASSIIAGLTRLQALAQQALNSAQTNTLSSTPQSKAAPANGNK